MDLPWYASEQLLQDECAWIQIWSTTKRILCGYHWAFCERYSLYKLWIFKCLQIKVEEAHCLEEEGEIPTGSGYRYCMWTRVRKPSKRVT